MRCRYRRIELAEPNHKRDIACGHGLRHGVAAVLDRPAEQRMQVEQRHVVDYDIGERRQIDELAFVKAERRIGGQAVNADDLDRSLPKGQFFPAGGQREVLGGHFFRRGRAIRLHPAREFVAAGIRCGMFDDLVFLILRVGEGQIRLIRRVRDGVKRGVDLPHCRQREVVCRHSRRHFLPACKGVAIARGLGETVGIDGRAEF